MSAMLLSRSSQPIFAADKPWETGGYFAVVGALLEEDEQTIRLYYRVSFHDHPQDNVLCVARSSDLVTWEKPDLGDGTNIVMRPASPWRDYGSFLPCRILREPDGTWLMLYWDKPREQGQPGFCLATSEDGLTWQPMADRPFITNSNDAASMVHALSNVPVPLGKAAYYIYQQTWKHNAVLPQGRDNLKGLHRRISIWRANELTGPWRGPIVVLEPDADDPPGVQFYWLAPFATSRGYGGLLHCHHTTGQTMDIQLVTSADGWSWQRELDRKPLIALGERGSFDCGMVYAWAAPLQWQGRVLLFYSGRATVHDAQPRFPDEPLPDAPCGIGIATLASDLLV